MSLPTHIALRYLFAKKSQNIINVISMISVLGIMTGTLALLVVLSVFNGLHGLIGKLYGSFDPELKIEAVEGKVFSTDSIPYRQLLDNNAILSISEVVTDQALIRYGRRQMPCLVMGVDANFSKVCNIDSIMVEGAFSLGNQHADFGVLGFILSEQMSVSLNFVSPLGIYVPRRNAPINLLNPESGFNSDYVMPAGIFAVKQMEYDSQYMIIGIDKARKLLEYDATKVSYLAVALKNGQSVNKTAASIQKLIGPNFTVKNKEMQHEAFYKMMKVEKLMAFLILSFIMVIAAFNVIGTLSMLIYEKKESIFTLKSMGASQRMVTRIFLIEGWMISLTGVVVGLLLGSLLIVVQQQFGIIKFQGGSSFVVDAYPIILNLGDILLVFATVSAIGLIAAWYPVKVIVRKYYHASKDEQ
ncbi:MAG: FtsX-like permease family protein [Breznakibacter sp.]